MITKRDELCTGATTARTSPATKEGAVQSGTAAHRSRVLAPSLAILPHLPGDQSVVRRRLDQSVPVWPVSQKKNGMLEILMRQWVVDETLDTVDVERLEAILLAAKTPVPVGDFLDDCTHCKK